MHFPEYKKKECTETKESYCPKIKKKTSEYNFPEIKKKEWAKTKEISFSSKMKKSNQMHFPEKEKKEWAKTKEITFSSKKKKSNQMHFPERARRKSRRIGNGGRGERNESHNLDHKSWCVMHLECVSRMPAGRDRRGQYSHSHKKAVRKWRSRDRILVFTERVLQMK